MKVQIGMWIEAVSRDMDRCPTTYAADHETLRTIAGQYPIFLDFVGGYTCPMPYWLLVKIDANRIDGRTYSGFGGNNFASREMPKGSAPLHVQMYDYALPKLVANGKVTLAPEYAHLAAEGFDRIAWAKSLTWDALRSLAA